MTSGRTEFASLPLATSSSNPVLVFGGDIDSAMDAILGGLLASVANDPMRASGYSDAASSTCGCGSQQAFALSSVEAFGIPTAPGYSDIPPAQSQSDEPTDGGEIVVKGTRPKEKGEEPDNYFDWDDGTGGGDIGSGGDGGGGGGGTSEPPDEPLDCRDRKALSAQDDINRGNEDVDEGGVIVYRMGDSLQKSNVIQGNEDEIPFAAIQAEMSRLGITRDQIVAFVHNHPAYEYGNSQEAAEINRFPSSNDWGLADWMVGGGAGGSGGSGFALYLIDTDGAMREFPYNDRNRYANLDGRQKQDERNLPPRIRGDGSSC